jgi:hypothetical protein
MPVLGAFTLLQRLLSPEDSGRGSQDTQYAGSRRLGHLVATYKQPQRAQASARPCLVTTSVAMEPFKSTASPAPYPKYCSVPYEFCWSTIHRRNCSLYGRDLMDTFPEGKEADLDRLARRFASVGPTRVASSSSQRTSAVYSLPVCRRTLDLLFAARFLLTL